MKRVLSSIAAVSCLALIVMMPISAEANDAKVPHSAVVDVPDAITLSVAVEAANEPPPQTDFRSDPSYPLWKVNSTAYILNAPAEEAEIIGLAYSGAELLQVGASEAEWVQVADPVNFRLGWISSKVLSPSEEKVALH
jgi:hypothetical protein